MDSEQAYRLTLARAAQYVGGAHALCARLGVPMREMAQWLEGKSKPPMYIFMKVIDIVLDEAQKPVFYPSTEAKPSKPTE